jgi:UDP-N-acetylmuramoyl-tripeptide--D-alanyl-D-alanine ligase
MDIAGLYQLFTRYPRITTDSRHDLEDSVFIGLRGERYNGNEYAAEALEKGARYAVVDEPALARGDKYILVDDSLVALQELAEYHREKLSIPIIAITGSNGKTTTKEGMAQVLSSRFMVTSTPGNLNNHIGVPLTILLMDESTEIGIVEMGANHHGEIGFLCRIAKPDYGLITNVGEAHLEGFGSLEGVKKAKGELYEYLEKQGGLIFCNSEDSHLLGMMAGMDAGVSWYGNGDGSVCSAEVLSSDPFLNISLSIPGKESFEIATGLAGAYNIQNILAAVAVGLHFRISPAEISSSLQGWSTNNNRSQRIETADNILIMDSYNANPTSMQAALESFRGLAHPAKVLILGDMLELGEGEEKAHRKMLEYLGELDYEKIFLVGPVFSGLSLPGEARAFTSVEELDSWLADNPLKDSLILLKASRGIGLEQLKSRL